MSRKLQYVLIDLHVCTSIMKITNSLYLNNLLINSYNAYLSCVLKVV